MHHTNTSSMGSDSTTSLFFRDLGARWLTTRSQERRAFERLGKSSAAARALLCTKFGTSLWGDTHTDGRKDKSEIGPAGKTRLWEIRAHSLLYFNAGG